MSDSPSLQPQKKYSDDDRFGYSNSPSSLDQIENYFEDEALAESFANGKDYILADIQEKLRKQQYKEALDIMNQYESVAKSNTKFAAMLQTARQGLERKEKIEILEMQLNSTPRTATRDRIRILQELAPLNSRYEAELNRYLNTDDDKDDDVNDVVDVDDDHPFMSPRLFFFAVCNILAIVIGISSIKDDPTDSMGYIFIAASIPSFFLQTNLKYNPIRNSTSKISLSILAWWVLAVAGVMIFPSNSGNKPTPEPTEITAPADPVPEATSQEESQAQEPNHPTQESHQNERTKNGLPDVKVF